MAFPVHSSITRSTNYKWWAFLAVEIGTFASVMDQGSVIVALPTIADHFKTDLPTVQWVMVVYALTISALLLPMGRLSDLIGRKRVYIAGFVIFVLGSALAGFSTDIKILIAARLIQGIGSAMTQGTGLAIVTSAFPGNERGKVMGLYLSVVGMGSIAGSPLGGFLVDALSWRWVFYATIGTGTLATLAPLIILDGRRVAEDGQRSRFDWPGAALSTGTLVTFLMAMTNGPRIGWMSPYVLGAEALFVALLATFIWWELRTPSPMLDLRLFKGKLFSLGVAAGFLSFVGSTPVRFLMPFYLQKVLEYSAAEIGLILIPVSLCMIITGPVSGRLSDRYGWRIFNVGGMILSASGLLILSRVTEDSHLAVVMVAMMLQNAGMGMFDTTNNSSIMGAVARERYGVVAGLLNLVRNSANVTGIAIATAIVTAIMASMGHPPTLQAVVDAAGSDTDVIGAFTSGLRTAYLVMGSLLLAGMVVSYLKGSRTRETPGRPQVEESRARTSQPD